MDSHPGGREHTLRLLSLGGLQPGSRVLDMGAGDGTGVALMKELGYEAQGIDLCPRGENVLWGDFLRSPWEEGRFDGILSQCAFYQSGDVPGAIREAHRLLKPGGVLMLSDVWFTDPLPLVEAAGFRVEYWEDITPQWKQYYIEAIWRGTEECVSGKGKCRYLLLICRKEGQDGPV